MESVTTRSSTRHTGELTQTVLQTLMIILLLKAKTAGFTPLSFMTEPLTLVESTLTVNSTGKVASVPLMVVDILSSVDVTTVKETTLVSLTRSLSGTKHWPHLKLLALLPVEAQSHHFLMKTVTDSWMLGKPSTLLIQMFLVVVKMLAFSPTLTLITKPMTKVEMALTVLLMDQQPSQQTLKDSLVQPVTTLSTLVDTMTSLL